MQRIPIAGERDVEGRVAFRDRAWHRVDELCSALKIFEIVSGVSFDGHLRLPKSPRSRFRSEPTKTQRLSARFFRPRFFAFTRIDMLPFGCLFSRMSW